MTCRIKDCPRPSRAKKLCDTHYRRILRGGGCLRCGKLRKRDTRMLCRPCYEGLRRTDQLGRWPVRVTRKIGAQDLVEELKFEMLSLPEIGKRYGLTRNEVYRRLVRVAGREDLYRRVVGRRKE